MQNKIEKLKAYKQTLGEITVKMHIEYDFVVKHDQVDQKNFLKGKIFAQKMLQDRNDKEIDKLELQIDAKIDVMQALIPLLPPREQD